MPVETHNSRVVFEVAFGALDDRSNEMLHSFAGVHLRALRDERLNIDVGAVSLHQAVDEEHHPVARDKRQRLHSVAVLAPPERQVRLEIDVTNATVAQPQRWWVTGVDDLRPSSSEVDTSQLPGDVLAAVEVLGKPDAGTSPARSANSRPARLPLRSAPTNTVARIAASSECPIASVSER